MALTKTICFRIDETYLQEIIKVSRKLGLPASALCRMAVIAYRAGREKLDRDISGKAALN